MISAENYDYLIRFRGGPLGADNREKERLRYLCKLGYLRAAKYNTDGPGVYPTAWQLTPAGEDALAEFEESRDQEAKVVREQRTEKKRDRAFDLLKLLLGGVITLFVEHFSEIVSWIIRLFS